MAKVTAYLCEDTGSLFLKEDDYKKHRRAFVAEKKRRDKRIAEKTELKEYFKNIRQKMSSVEELTKLINKNYYVLLEKALRLEGPNGFGHSSVVKLLNAHAKDPKSSDFKIEISFKRPDYMSNQRIDNFDQSNSHHCPENGVTNWGGRVEGAPRGYPGTRWDFKVKYKEKSAIDPTTGMRMVLDALRLNPGCGGSYYGDMEVFSADWPFQLREQYANAFASKLKRGLDYLEPLIQERYPELDKDALRSVIELQGLNFEDTTVFVCRVLENYDNQQLKTTMDVLSTVKTGKNSFINTVDEMLSSTVEKQHALPDFDLGL